MPSVRQEQAGLLEAEHAPEAVRWTLPDLGGKPAAPPKAADLEAVQEAAYQEGLERGLAEGRAKAKVQMDAEVARLAAINRALTQPLLDLDNEVTQEITRLARTMAEQLVRRELSLAPDALAEIVADAFEYIRAESRTLTIRMTTEDIEAIREHLPEEVLTHCRLIADAGMEQGDVQIQGDAMRIDARVRTRLQELAQKLQHAV